MKNINYLLIGIIAFLIGFSLSSIDSKAKLSKENTELRHQKVLIL